MDLTTIILSERQALKKNAVRKNLPHLSLMAAYQRLQTVALAEQLCNQGIAMPVTQATLHAIWQAFGERHLATTDPDDGADFDQSKLGADGRALFAGIATATSWIELLTVFDQTRRGSSVPSLVPSREKCLIVEHLEDVINAAFEAHWRYSPEMQAELAIL